MTNLVTSADVKEIYSTARTDVTIFIDMAHEIITTYVLPAGYSESYLAIIEKYLAAHFVALTEEGGGVTSTTTGESEDKYSMPKPEFGLSITRFGRTALALDTKATLAALAAPTMKAQIQVV